MKNVLAVLLTIAGLTLLAIGYTTPARVRAERAALDKAGISVAVWESKFQGEMDAKELARDYADTMKRAAEGKAPTPQEELALSIGKNIEAAQKAILKDQKDSLRRLTDFLEDNSSGTRGAIQCCTGWLLIAAACIVFALGKTGNRVHL